MMVIVRRAARRRLAAISTPFVPQTRHRVNRTRTRTRRAHRFPRVNIKGDYSCGMELSECPLHFRYSFTLKAFEYFSQFSLALLHSTSSHFAPYPENPSTGLKGNHNYSEVGPQIYLASNSEAKIRDPPRIGNLCSTLLQ